MNKYNNKLKKTDPLNNLLSTIGNLFASLGRWIWSLVSGKRTKKFNQVENLRKWHEIEDLLASHDEIHAQQAVIRADKYFDEIMRQAGAHGEKFADRLRSLESRLNRETYQSIWDAHKLRNQISHDVEHKSSVVDCKIALSKFKRGLQSLGAL